MQKFLYPMLVLLVLAIVGGVAYVKSHKDEAPSSQTEWGTEDADGDHDGDTEASEETPQEESVTTSAPHETTKPEEPTPTPTPTPAPSGHTMAEVRTHNSAQSCWTAIAGTVYDLTSWIKQHPGGQGAILRLCGTDGTNAFESQHGGQARPERELASFAIGALI